MFSRLENSWELVKASAKVLQKDKELLIFPLLSAVASVLVVIGFAVPLFTTNLANTLANSPNSSGIAAGFLFLFYLAQYFVIFFANAGLIGAALIRLRGGDPTVSDGLRIAARHAGSLFVYALISATVGMILRMLAERLGFLGRIIVGLFGSAWSVATFLVVPILVTEEIGPVDAISRSTSLLKKTWGEQLIVNAGINVVFNWLLFLSILLFLGGMYLAVLTESALATLPVVGLCVTWVLGLSLLRATLSGVYAAALYRFSAEGDVSSDFNPQLIQTAFRSK